MNFQYLIKSIDIDCIKHEGNSFSFDISESFRYKETYDRIQKGLFTKSYEWRRRIDTDESFDIKQMKEFEGSLQALPEGITYSKKIDIEKDGTANSQPGILGSVAYKTLKARFTIHVSEQYSSKMAKKGILYEGRPIILKDRVFIDVSEEKLYPEAVQFKNKLMASYRNIVKDAYVDLQTINVSRSEVSAWINNLGGYPQKITIVDYEKYGMMPLRSDFQIYGFAMALAEYGAEKSTNSEHYYLKCHYGENSLSDVDLEKVIIPPARPKLKEW